jgi:RhtB (resistance to homoserine/threonine) family protein
MSFLTAWATVSIICLLGAMIPGASFAMILRNSIANSRKTGIFTAVGLGLGMVIYASLTIFGLSALITEHLLFAHLIKWFGAVYLLYIGILCLMAKPKADDVFSKLGHANHLPAFKAIRMGFITTLLNPKVILFFIALFSQFLHPGAALWQQGILAITISLIEFGWFSFVAIVLTHPFLQKRYTHIAHWIERAAGLVLIILAIELAFSHIL